MIGSTSASPRYAPRETPKSVLPRRWPNRSGRGSPPPCRRCEFWMVAVKAGDVEGVLRRVDPRIGIYLVYGPDIGLVNERAKIVAERAVDDPADPFQLIRLDGDDIAGDPGRLADEAGTMGLFGGKRALWIRATSRNLAPAVEAVLKSELQDTAIVIEGGDLAKSSPLRTLCEKSARAFALPCYADTGRDVGAVID